MLVRVFRSRIVCLLGLGTPPSQRNWPWRGADPSGSKLRCEELDTRLTVELRRAISSYMESIYGAMWSLI